MQTAGILTRCAWQGIGFIALLVFVSGGAVVADADTGVQMVSRGESRFTILTEFKGQAVRDTATGLIWELTPQSGVYDWETAHQRCSASSVGGHTGWRIPTLDELRTLIDPTMIDVKLPAGHPFSRVESALYWSATKSRPDAPYAWTVNFSSGSAMALERYMAGFVWCVRDRTTD
ncbi:MAG TPA: DUF1566 domain-containing protein [Nitrospira sp.]|nr:DUF1566 domain-containing protein [Nitrospira sp.]